MEVCPPRLTSVQSAAWGLSSSPTTLVSLAPHFQVKARGLVVECQTAAVDQKVVRNARGKSERKLFIEKTVNLKKEKGSVPCRIDRHTLAGRPGSFG